MTKDIFSDEVLVYDRYYCSKPNTLFLIFKRIFLAAVFGVCSMLFLLKQYRFPVSLTVMAAVCGGSCVAFSVLFILVRKRFAIPGIILVSGIALAGFREVLAENLTWFADAFMTLVDGRFLHTQSFLFHQGEIFDTLNVPYIEGVFLGTVLLCIVYSVIVSACFSGRLVLVPVVFLFVALCVPAAISEKLEFSWWLIPALAALSAAFAIRKNYSCGLAVSHRSSSDYFRRIHREEKNFFRRIASLPYRKRLVMRSNYSCKYFSTGIYSAALAAVCLLTGVMIIPDGGSIDYSSVYDMVVSLGRESGYSQSPFEDGIASEYFTQSGTGHRERLNIISPGSGEREIIRVTYTGERPVYLRGDIGIEFNGASWSSAVSSEPEQWQSGKLKESYRPCEGLVNSVLLTAADYETNAESDSVTLITSSDVSIEYLCNTDVVFLPPYTAEYSFYNNEAFDVYSDYVVRVNASAGSYVNSVQCTALLPTYTSNERYSGNKQAVKQLVSAYEFTMCEPDDIYNSVVPEMTAENILSDYEQYVENTYLSLDEQISYDIEQYIGSTIGYILDEIAEEYDIGNISSAEYRYNTADAVAEYLRTHYTYSLDGGNNGANPVMQFLNETKKGHCSLYASAMTLILRERGIPARYCTGFYVEKDNGSSSVVLKEKNLHAWVEVYLGQYGWVTFDPTSSSAYPERSVQDNPAPGTNEHEEVFSEELSSEATRSYETTVEYSEAASEPLTAESITTDAEATGSSFSGIFPLMITAGIIILILIGLAVFVLLRAALLKKSAHRTLEKLRQGGAEASHTVYRLILALLEFSGIIPGKGEFPEDYFSRADKQLGTQLADYSHIFVEMEFGGHEISPDMAEKMYSQLIKITAVLRVFGFPGKLKLLRLISDFINFY